VEGARSGAKEEAVKRTSKKSNQDQEKLEAASNRAAISAAEPYSLGELDAAREALGYLSNVAPYYLESFEEEHADLLARLYPFEPRHLLLRQELDELFDTTPDLSGADIDISRFIRSGDERDLHVFWVDIPEKTIPSHEIRPSRDALCAVPFLGARDWLFEKDSDRKKPGMRVCVWNWLDGEWERPAGRRDLYPGQTVLVAANSGGYRNDLGWCAESEERVEPVPDPDIAPDELADAGQDDESLSAYPWQTIAVHGRNVGRLAREIADILTPSLAGLLALAGRWHDVGKVFPAFQGSIDANDRPERQDLAKAPKRAWLPVNKLYPMSEGGRRAGFRHELASTLAIFSVLQRHSPDHEALLGPWRELLMKAGIPPKEVQAPEVPPTLLEKEILPLDAAHFNLLVYLVCTHHGKVRLAWHASPTDQASAGSAQIRGVRDGDFLPAIALSGTDDSIIELPPCALDLAPAGAGLNPRTGAGWTERVLDLLAHRGPFVLAWLEALLRAADQRASRQNVEDELLTQEVNQ
jgi:CRISPR-associated endonuclease/helicase Cas3